MTAAVQRPGASSAFGWSVLNTVLSRLGTLGIGIVLARVLGPESFGTFAVALVALMAVLSFNELGVSLAIVRWPDDPARIVPTVNTISVASSALFCTAAIFAAPIFTAAVGDPEATDVIRLLILSVFINGVVASPAALLQREFQEKKRLGIDQVNVWTGAVLSLVLALAGMGAMALAIGRVTGSLISAVMFLRASPMPYRFGLNRTLVGPLLRFGLPLAGTSIIFFAVGYSDQLAAGTLLGSAALGFYVLAFNLSNWPVSIIAQPLRRVAPAAFSSVQADGWRMVDTFVSVVSILASAMFPIVLFMVGSAVPLIGLVYGDEWLPAAAALAWLVIAAASKMFCDLAYDFLVIEGKSGTVFTIQATCLCFLVPALIAGADRFGLQGLAAAQALVTVIVVLPLYLWQMHRNSVRLAGIWHAVRLPLLAALPVGGLSFAFAHWIPAPAAALIAGGSTAVAVCAVLLWLQRDALQLLRTIGSSTNTTDAELVP